MTDNFASDEPGHAPAGHLTRTVLQTAPSPVSGWEIEQTLVQIPVGASSGRHSHPGPEVGYIIHGDISMEFDDGRDALELHDGSPFLIPPGVIHNAVNVGSITTRMLSTYFFDETQPLVTQY
jgi:quercetin dioxygenase-like cupin family protein